MKEFDFINNLINEIELKLPEGFIGIGDDAALLGDYLIAKDLIVSDVHFQLNAGLENILFKLVTSNVSDIAAMGGVPPLYALLGISNDGSIDMTEFVDALKKVLNFYSVILIGGDTTSSKKGVFLSLTIIGHKNSNLLRRSGAKVGDLVYLSRPVGLSKVSLEKELGVNCFDIDATYHYKQVAEVSLGSLLGKIIGITSCIDISDGLGRDIGHIADASKVCVILDEAKIDLSHLNRFNLDDPLRYFLSSGEEYALVFTVDGKFKNIVDHELQEFLSVMQIGEVVEGEGVYLKTKNGVLYNISNCGYEHTTG